MALASNNTSFEEDSGRISGMPLTFGLQVQTSFFTGTHVLLSPYRGNIGRKFKIIRGTLRLFGLTVPRGAEEEEDEKELYLCLALITS